MSDSEKSGPWRLVVDPERCQGHNRCHALAPDLFKIDDLGFASAASERVPDGSIELARLAVRNCPEFAIRLSHASSRGDDT